MIELLLEGLSSLICFPLELFGAAVALSLSLEKRKHFAIRLVFSAMIFFLAALLGTLHFLFGGEPPSGSLHEWGNFARSLLWCVLIFLMLVGSLLLSRCISIREAIYCGSCAYLVEHLAYCARILLLHLVPAAKMSPDSIWYYVVTVGVYAAAYQLFTRPMVRNGHYATTARSSLWLMIAVLSVVLVLSVFASAFDFVFLHSIYAIFCGVFVLVGEVSQQKEMRLREELEFQREMTARQKAQYELSRENIEVINRKCHDLKHQIAALRQIRDGEKKNKIISSLEESVMIYDSIYKTGNDILDTVLTEKSLLCSHKNITLSCIADGKLLGFMQEVDVYTLFGNALDNAIEAVLKLEKDDRLIDLSIRSVADVTVIKVVNNFVGELIFSEGLPTTLKEDKNYHGFGLKSIKSITEKYNGIAKIHTNANCFTLQITFPPQI